MSHYHCEIILPPGTEDVEAAVEKVLAPFSQHLKHEEREGPVFWDWYVIGGRWSGAKIQARLSQGRVKEFNEMLVARKITVSGVFAGKQTLDPASQIEEVDRLWREWFPESGLQQCPIFDHFTEGDEDVCELSAVAPDLTCYRVIFADSELRARFMLVTDIWNGTTHQKTTWDGTIKQALELAADHYLKINPPANSLVVTVDYHS